MFKVLLIDRCYFSRFGLKLWLEKSADLSVNFYVVETDNLLFAREHILKHQPNIVLADFHGFISELHNLHQLSSIASACGNITRLIVMQSQHSPQELVDQTKAVLQVEGQFNGDSFRIKGLIPIDSKNPTNFSRVQGVGVSAQIDVKI